MSRTKKLDKKCLIYFPNSGKFIFISLFFLRDNNTINVGQDIFTNLIKTHLDNENKINLIISILSDQINQVKKIEKKEFLKLLPLASIKKLSK